MTRLYDMTTYIGKEFSENGIPKDDAVQFALQMLHLAGVVETENFFFSDDDVSQVEEILADCYDKYFRPPHSIVGRVLSSEVIIVEKDKLDDARYEIPHVVGEFLDSYNFLSNWLPSPDNYLVIEKE